MNMMSINMFMPKRGKGAMSGVVTCLWCLLLIISGVVAPSPNPLFTIRFDAEGATETNYANFIAAIRNQLQNTAAPYTSHELPVARPVNRRRPPMFAIDLRTHTGQATLYLRADTVYFEGYRDSTGRLFELDSYNTHHELQHRWTNSTFMGFRETYGAFRRAGGPLIGTHYGPGEMVQAANQLAQGQHNGQAVVTLVVMISEAVRFSAVLNTMRNLYRDSSSVIAPRIWQTLVHVWSDLSQGLLYDDIRPVNFAVFAVLNIYNAHQAAGALGLILNPCGPWRGVSLQMLGRRHDVEDIFCWEGVPMLEIFKVVVVDIDGENPGDLYGNVTLAHSVDAEHIFNRQRSEYQSVGPNQEAELTGPSTGVPALADFSIFFDLWDRDRDLSPDDQVAKGSVEWTMADDFANDYDVVAQDTVTGEHGSVQVSYAVFQAAVEARIRVVLVNGDEEDPADIYGRIVARNSLTGSAETVLFKRGSDENIPVRPWKDIPLRRSVVAAPMNTDRFVVEMEVWDHDRDLSPDDEVARGTVYLTPESSGETRRYVSGQYGSVLLIVRWSVPLF